MSQEHEIEAKKLSQTTDFLPSDGAPCSGFFVRGWVRAYTKIAGTNQIESSERARGVIYGEEYRQYWAAMRAKAHTRMRTAAKTAGAKLSFGAFNSVEIHIPNA